MFTLYVVVTCVTAFAVAASALTDLARAQFVLANSAAVGVPQSSLPALATLKLAGALGLLVGLFGVRPLAVAAAVGLVAFFVGAVIVHVRARVLDTVGYPAAYLALAIASLVLVALR
jgi:DoxX-like family